MKVYVPASSVSLVETVVLSPDITLAVLSQALKLPTSEYEVVVVEPPELSPVYSVSYTTAMPVSPMSPEILPFATVKVLPVTASVYVPSAIVCAGTLILL